MRFLLQPKQHATWLLASILSLGVFLNHGCVPVYTGVPAVDAVNIAGGALMGISAQQIDTPPPCVDIDVHDFLHRNRIFKSDLRQGERVLIHKRWSLLSQGFLVITDERVINYDTEKNEHCAHAELTSIQRISQINDQYRFCLKLYDGRFITIFTFMNNRDIVEVIRAQVEHIDSIRNELGIVMPANVDTAELQRLNEPVMAELRARRN